MSYAPILAAILFSLFPVIYDISRNMLLDLALTVWVVWGLYFWIKRNDWGVVIMMILASLTKLNGFIYFVPMLGWNLWESRKSEKRFLTLVAGGLVYLAVVGWWWGINSQNIYLYLTGLAGQGEAATDPMNLTSWVTWIHYFRLFFLNQLGPITAILFLILSKKENRKLVVWTVATYVIFTIIKNKDFRFTMPILPVLAVWWGWGLYQTHPSGQAGHPPLTRRVRQVFLWFTLVWMGFNYIENSYNWPIKKPVVVYTPTFLMGNVNWIDFSDYPVREFRKAIWPNEKILADIPNEPEKLLMVMNVAELNDNTLGFYRVKEEKNNLQIHGIDKWGKMEFDYIVVPEEGEESAPFYDTQLEVRKEAIKEIWGNTDKYQRMAEYSLPSGGKVWLLRVL
jgi:4-amino-4-deoxy-L-arabinose transferase-like glycosyltransferase